MSRMKAQNPASRLRGSQTDILGESGLAGGDESFVSGKNIEFTSDEI